MKKIYKKEQEYKSLYENNLSAIFTYNRDAIIVEANERAAEMTGYPIDKIIGQGFLYLNHGERSRTDAVCLPSILKWKCHEI